MVHSQNVDVGVIARIESVAGTAIGRVPTLDILGTSDEGEVLEITQHLIAFGHETIWAIGAGYAVKRELAIVVLSGVGNSENGWVAGERRGEDGDNEKREYGEDGIEKHSRGRETSTWQEVKCTNRKLIAP